MFFDVANRLIFILLGTIWMIYQLYNKQTPQTTHSPTDHISTERIVSKTENVTHPMFTVEDVHRIGNETRKTTLKIVQSSDKQRPQTTHSPTDHISTERIVSKTENVTHPMFTVEDVHRIGNETRKTTLKIVQSSDKQRPQTTHSPTDHISTERIVSKTENVTHPMFTVEDVHRIGNETRKTTLKIVQSSDKQRPQTTHSPTDHISTERIVSKTENVTHPMFTVEDVHRIGNETRKTTLKIVQSSDKQLPIFIRSPLNEIDSQGNVFRPKIVTSNDFSVDYDVQDIKIETEERNYDMVLDILLTRTNAQRQQVANHYKKIFKTSLLNEMDNVEPNNLKLLLQDLSTDTSVLFAEELYKAIYTSNLQMTTSLLMDLWENEFDQVENIYKLYSNEPIWKSIEKRFGKSTQEFIQCVVETRKVKIKEQLTEGDVYKPIVNMSEVNKTFHVLLKQMNSMEHNQQQLSNLLCKLNPFQIDELDMMYQRDFKRKSSELIERGSTGEMHDLLMSLYTYSVMKPTYFATLIHDALYKEPINTLTAQRLLIFRSEIDLQTVCDLYEAEYGINLSDDVKQKYFNGQDNALTVLLRMRQSIIF
ncbi:unnamed protein product [Schistosoma margrebowiei]|uniref:Annexin n=1 Tax=Schistosoma margrebowiei TaxID=48269 RepID=A0AA85AIA3_9TREM|nr:unnamed protein product [Schistosoma margrebowiei]